MIPGFTANASLSGPAGGHGHGPAAMAPDRVSLQLSACSPCIRLPAGRHCLTIPVINKRVCVNIPSLGSWRVCCRPKLLPPFISCGVSRC